jgi:flagellar biosynthesis/type III secretory pathway protein FliH
MEDYIAKAKKEGKEEGKDLSNEAFEATKKFLKMIRQLSINLHTS